MITSKDVCNAYKSLYYRQWHYSQNLPPDDIVHVTIIKLYPLSQWNNKQSITLVKTMEKKTLPHTNAIKKNIWRASETKCNQYFVED